VIRGIATFVFGLAFGMLLGAAGEHERHANPIPRPSIMRSYREGILTDLSSDATGTRLEVIARTPQACELEARLFLNDRPTPVGCMILPDGSYADAHDRVWCEASDADLRVASITGAEVRLRRACGGWQ